MQKAKVLIVDDDEAERRLLSAFLLSKPELEVETARDGVEALHQLSRGGRYDVILLDVMMPLMSGVDFLDSLRALTDDPSVKTIDKTPAVIVITAASDSVLPNDAIFHRYPEVVRGVFRKPVDMARLSACLEQLR
jgi:CheY-like chemotaxis protein